MGVRTLVEWVEELREDSSQADYCTMFARPERKAKKESGGKAVAGHK